MSPRRMKVIKVTTWWWWKIDIYHRAIIKGERSGQEKTKTWSDREKGDATQPDQSPGHPQPRAHQAQPAQDRERREDWGTGRWGRREEETFGQSNVIRDFTTGVWTWVCTLLCLLDEKIDWCHCRDVLDYVKTGMASIIEDEVTSRFVAEELKSWNLMTRANSQFEFINWRLTAFWLLGGMFRYFFLLPARLLILVIGVSSFIIMMSFKSWWLSRCSSWCSLVLVWAGSQANVWETGCMRESPSQSSDVFQEAFQEHLLNKCFEKTK